MELSRLAMFLCQIAIISFTRGQTDCPAFATDLLGSTDAASETGLVRRAIVGIVGEGGTVSVQVHSSSVVCLVSGQTRNTYSGISVVVNYTCNGASHPACNGNPTNSQFDFRCDNSQWGTGDSPENSITFPSTGSLSTILRSDCGVCASPMGVFATITNNDQHCGCKY